MLTKKELETKTDAVIETTRSVLQTVVDALNKGQRKKLMNNEDAADLIRRYGVEVSE